MSFWHWDNLHYKIMLHFEQPGVPEQKITIETIHVLLALGSLQQPSHYD
jgi:hypothetical protein